MFELSIFNILRWATILIMVLQLWPERLIWNCSLRCVSECFIRGESPVFRERINLSILMVVSACWVPFAGVIVTRASRNWLLFSRRWIFLPIVRHDLGGLETSPSWNIGFWKQLVLLGSFLKLVFVFCVWRSDVEDFRIVFDQVIEILNLLISLSISNVARGIDHLENVSRVLGTCSAIFTALLLLACLTANKVQRICFVFFVWASTVKRFSFVFRLFRLGWFLLKRVFDKLCRNFWMFWFFVGSKTFNLFESLLASELGLNFLVMHPVEGKGSSSINHRGVVALLDLGIQKLFW